MATRKTVMQEVTIDGIVVDSRNWKRITLPITEDNLLGIQAAAARDSRDVVHIFNVALHTYLHGGVTDNGGVIKERKLPVKRR